MKVAFDAQPLVDNQKTGIGFYESRLLQAMGSLKSNWLLELNYFGSSAHKRRADSLKDFIGDQFKWNSCIWMKASLYKLIWPLIPIPYRLFFGRSSQLTHFFNYHIPPGVEGGKVCTVHDMTYKVYPETVRFKTKLLLNLSLVSSCRRADKIITISEFSKQEIMRWMDIPPEKIEIVPCGVDFSVFHPDYPKNEVKSVIAKYSLPSKYLLYLGTLEPRKNLLRLIRAYGKMREKQPVAPALVLAGRKGWIYKEIFKMVTSLGLEKHVIFTGYIPDEDVPLLLNGAFAFVFPSLYEGFGMPPLEAMACGTPVLTADAASLPEVVGDAAILVNPHSIEDIAYKLLLLVNDAELRQKLSRKGICQAAKYTWENAAIKLSNVYENLLGSRE